MTEQLITSDNLSNEYLASIFNDAFMEVSYGEDGSISIRENGVRVWVEPLKSKRFVKLMVLYKIKADSSELSCLQSVNSINESYIIKTASIEDGFLKFEYMIPIVGGITKKAFVLALKLFSSIPMSAVEDLASDIVELR